MTLELLSQLEPPSCPPAQWKQDMDSPENNGWPSRCNESSQPPLRLKPRKTSDHKGTFGRVLLAGGSRGMAGSISLSAIAALHTGSGLVAAAIPGSVLGTVAGFHPALMTMAMPDQDGCFSVEAWECVRKIVRRQDAIGLGPGMGTGEGSLTLVQGLLQQRQAPLVIDADALNIVSEQNWFGDTEFARQPEDAPVVLTPHPGELARLTGVPASDAQGQLKAAIGLARRMRMTVVVKGGPSRVVGDSSPDDFAVIYENETGNPAMATGGCGDVLTGVITSLLGQGLSGWDAARLGVWIHGRAGDVAAEQTSVAGMTAWHLVHTLAAIADEMLET